MYSDKAASTDDINEFLFELRLLQHLPKFQQNGYDNMVLLDDMDKKELTDMYSVLELSGGHKLQIERALNNRKRKSNGNSARPSDCSKVRRSERTDENKYSDYVGIVEEKKLVNHFEPTNVNLYKTLNRLSKKDSIRELYRLLPKNVRDNWPKSKWRVPIQPKYETWLHVLPGWALINLHLWVDSVCIDYVYKPNNPNGQFCNAHILFGLDVFDSLCAIQDESTSYCSRLGIDLAIVRLTKKNQWATLIGATAR